MSSNQEKVAEFIEKHDMDATPAFRIIDVMAELGEVASDAAKSADYGQREEELEVKEDEIGDALFSLLSLAESLDIDAEKALEKSLQKYGSRIDEKGDAGSGE
jgi:NTP pyrophosphatase (non-canonical NTP hydrolase)